MSKFKPKTTPNFDNDFKKVRKDFELVRRLKKKIQEVLQNPFHYKTLRNVFKNTRRTHIGSYVLIFKIDENNKTITFNKFQYHDDAYKSKK